MSHAVAKLTGQEQVNPRDNANLVHREADNIGVFYKIRPVGEGLEQWFAAFQEAQRQDGTDTIHRFYEVLPSHAITKFSLRIPSGAQDDAVIRSACGYVAHKLLSPASYELSDVSYWYRLDANLYGVWPMIAMTALDRRTALDLLDSGAQDQWTPFQRSWMDHYYVDGNHRIEFPLPAGGAQWIGVFNHEGLPKVYSASTHGRRMAHLVVNGGFLFNANPAINALQIANVYQALRIGLLTNLLITQNRQQVPKDPGYHEGFNRRRSRIREDARLRQQTEQYQAAAPKRQLDRLNFIQALDVLSDDAVDILYECQARDATESEQAGSAIPEYFHTYNQMNRWFLFEIGCQPPRLWYKTYDEKRLMLDPDRPERYLTIDVISPQAIRQRFSQIQVMVANPGKTQPKYLNIYDAWIGHRQCNSVRSVVICPLSSDASLINPYKVRGQFNRWRGWDFYAHEHYDRLHAQLHSMSLAEIGHLDTVRTINAFIFGMLCNQDYDCFRIITLILANVLQRPDSKPEKAVFLKGPEGVGKSLFSKSLLKHVFGFTHAVEFDRTEYIVGNFNESCSGKAFIILEEALFGGDKQTCGRFQQMVTGEFQAVNAKYQAVRIELNLSTFWANTNRDFPITVNQNGRRYVFVDVSNLVIYLNQKKKSGFFNRIAELLDSDKIFLYAYFLSRIPLDEWFKVRNTTVIENAELGKQKIMSMSSEKPMAAWLMGCAAARTFGRTDKGEHDIMWGQPAALSDLYELFVKTRKYAPGLMIFTHDLCVALGGVKGFDPKYSVDPRLAIARKDATWVKLPSYEHALQHLQSRIGGTSEVGSLESIGRHLEHESKLMKLGEAPSITAEQLLPEYEDLLDSLPAGQGKAEALMIALFGAVDHVVVPCQKE